MSSKQTLVLAAYLLIFGGFGFAVGGELATDKQTKINDQLQKEYNELKENYDNLETEYKWKLDSCYQQLGDMQDDYDVNNDGKVNAQDYVAIKNYIMNKDELGD